MHFHTPVSEVWRFPQSRPDSTVSEVWRFPQSKPDNTVSEVWRFPQSRPDNTVSEVWRFPQSRPDNTVCEVWRFPQSRSDSTVQEDHAGLQCHWPVRENRVGGGDGGGLTFPLSALVVLTLAERHLCRCAGRVVTRVLLAGIGKWDGSSMPCLLSVRNFHFVREDTSTWDTYLY